MQPELDDLIGWAHEAGAVLLEGYGSLLKVEHKGPTDLVTEYDRRSEDLLVRRILEKFPDHTLITEESGRLNGHNTRRWYVDPLDGTVNFAHGVPVFSVSIAYAEDGELQLGVVYDPMRAETFAARRGGGATLNGKTIQVAGAKTLLDSLLATGFPYNINGGRKPDNLDLFVRFARRAQGLRRLGSAALDLCYVACGRYDGYWEPVLQPYDLAAGTLITREAGGVVTKLNGDPDLLQQPCSVAAANPALHPLLMEVIREGE